MPRVHFSKRVVSARRPCETDCHLPSRDADSVRDLTEEAPMSGVTCISNKGLSSTLIKGLDLLKMRACTIEVSNRGLLLIKYRSEGLDPNGILYPCVMGWGLAGMGNSSVAAVLS